MTSDGDDDMGAIRFLESVRMIGSSFSSCSNYSLRILQWQEFVFRASLYTAP